MPRYVCCCRYDGTAYRGFQVQVEENTVCRVLQDALEQLFRVRPEIKGCSRTDSGVHAYAFCFSFLCEKEIDPKRLPAALNTFLPPDVAVVQASFAPEDFHPRYDCLGKEYVYRVLNRRLRDPFYEKKALLWPGKLDEEMLNRAARAFVGEKDFTSFCGSNGKVKEDMVREITEFSVTRKGDEIFFRVRGTGFLYHMVRIMVGTLLQIAQSVYPEDSVEEMLQAKDRRVAGMTAPAHGLYLNRVFYDPVLLSAAEEGAPWLK